MDLLTLRRPAIVSVAGLYERKGIRDLLFAFADVARTHKEATLYVVGDGPDKSAFEELARSLGCGGNVVFTGFIRDPRPYLAQSDIFVLASRKDPSPLVIPEAREAGCAIVATRVDGIPEALDGGGAGILVEPQKPQELGQVLARLLSDPNERMRLAHKAQENLESLQLSRTVSETLAIYAEARRDR
jgi:glycosyltransferase involved in cell wall biosynthesis